MTLDRRPYEMVPTTREHALALMRLMRAADAAELESAGMSREKGVWRSWRGSVMARTMMVGDEIACIWGMGGAPLGTVGHPWVLTTPVVERVPLSYVRAGREAAAIMLAACPVLNGIVDASYEGAVRYLRMLGFSIGEPFPFGPYRRPFCKYEMVRWDS